MIKLLLLTMSVTFLIASNSFVSTLKERFLSTVILEPIYLKRFKAPLDEICMDQKPSCYTFQIQKLYEMIPVWSDEELITLLRKKMQKRNTSRRYEKSLIDVIEPYKPLFLRSQFFVILDLQRQLLHVMFFDFEDQLVHKIGSDIISSGNIDKELFVENGEDHYLKTPTGIYSVRGGWRSTGEILDDNITMPYGHKDRFIFYLGKQKSVRYNTFDENGTKVEDKNSWRLIEDELEFAIHAHKSTTTFGYPYSHGCVRMRHELNVYLDNAFVLHKNAFNGQYEWNLPFSNAPKSEANTIFAGEFLFIYDTIK